MCPDPAPASRKGWPGIVVVEPAGGSKYSAQSQQRPGEPDLLRRPHRSDARLRENRCKQCGVAAQVFLQRSAVNNPYAGAYHQLFENVIVLAMEKRAIRAWHDMRLTDVEAELLRTGGVYASTLETIYRRLDAQVSEGLLSVETAAALLRPSSSRRPKVPSSCPRVGFFSAKRLRERWPESSLREVGKSLGREHRTRH